MLLCKILTVQEWCLHPLFISRCSCKPPSAVTYHWSNRDQRSAALCSASSYTLLILSLHHAFHLRTGIHLFRCSMFSALGLEAIFQRNVFTNMFLPMSVHKLKLLTIAKILLNVKGTPDVITFLISRLVAALDWIQLSSEPCNQKAASTLWAFFCHCQGPKASSTCLYPHRTLSTFCGLQISACSNHSYLLSNAFTFYLKACSTAAQLSSFQALLKDDASTTSCLNQTVV